MSPRLVMSISVLTLIISAGTLFTVVSMQKQLTSSVSSAAGPTDDISATSEAACTKLGGSWVAYTDGKRGETNVYYECTFPGVGSTPGSTIKYDKRGAVL